VAADSRWRRTFIGDKLAAARLPGDIPPEAEVGARIVEEAKSLKDEVVRLRFNAATLRPVVLQGRQVEGPVEERLARASEELTQRLNNVVATRQNIVAAVEVDWDQVAQYRAPGGLILDAVARRYGVRFSKESGDSAKLARLVRREAIPEELRQLMSDVART